MFVVFIWIGALLLFHKHYIVYISKYFWLLSQKSFFFHTDRHTRVFAQVIRLWHYDEKTSEFIEADYPPKQMSLRIISFTFLLFLSLSLALSLSALKIHFFVFYLSCSAAHTLSFPLFKYVRTQLIKWNFTFLCVHKHTHILLSCTCLFRCIT